MFRNLLVRRLLLPDFITGPLIYVFLNPLNVSEGRCIQQIAARPTSSEIYSVVSGCFRADNLAAKA